MEEDPKFPKISRANHDRYISSLKFRTKERFHPGRRVFVLLLSDPEDIVFIRVMHPHRGKIVSNAVEKRMLSTCGRLVSAKVDTNVVIDGAISR